MRFDAAWPGRVFQWVDKGTAWRAESESLYVVLSKWTPPGSSAHLKILVLHTTYPYHTPASIMELRPSDRMWVEAKRIV